MQPQQAPQAPLIFAETERPLGERLMKLALETDRVEGYTEPHAVMIARLAETIGRQVGLHGPDLTALKFAALAHDIGERGLKRNYLLQPNALTWEETLDLWRHPILGEQAAAELQLPRQTQLLIRWHHEWWNGQGYPDGLAGAAIPVGARILRAVDSYCALISQRPYRQRYDLAEAEQIIADLAGIEFDPYIAKLLLTLVVAERKQREAEVWSVPPAYEPAVSAVSAVEAPVAEEQAIEEATEIPTPIYSPDDDTLTDFAITEADLLAANHTMPSPAIEQIGQPAEIDTPATPTVGQEEQAGKDVTAEASAALETVVAPVASPIEALPALPYGDVLMHQPVDESPAPTAADEAQPIAPAAPEADDQQPPAPKIPS